MVRGGGRGGGAATQFEGYVSIGPTDCLDILDNYYILTEVFVFWQFLPFYAQHIMISFVKILK